MNQLRTVSSIPDCTIPAIRIWNGTILSSTETMRISTKHMRDNARETSTIVVNGAKMLEEATYIPNSAKRSSSIENRAQ
jgi:hypothetical protein